MGRWRIILGIALFGFLGIGWFLRLDRYALAIRPIFSLPRPLWKQAYLAMQETETKDGIRGILARVSGNGMWLLRGASIEYVKVGELTAYSYWQACEDFLQNEHLKEGESREIGRWVGESLNEWSKKIKAGDAVEVYYGGNKKGTEAREVYGYDWRLYLPPPADLKQQ